MDLVNIGRSRRFLRERPIRVNLFDRPRLVCDLLCLETRQTEKRRGLGTSDSLYVVIEGKARLVTGHHQVEEMEAQDAALVPPGVDHTIENIGTERLTVMALVTPKPTRAAEVRMPAQERPRGRAYRDDSEPRPQPRAPSRFEGPPPRDRRAPRAAAGDRERGDSGEAEGPVWFPRPKPAWRPRGRPPGPPGRGGKPQAAQGRREGGGGTESAGRRRSGSGSPGGRAPGRGRPTGPGQPGPRGGSRGRPPPRRNARPAPGRNAPRTSTRRQSREQ